ncbi:carbohydrate ABC transporter permease [Propionibacteriaceae bacterium Y1700]|uniref:carbohydrate ABC transporter permease n=1 Tax=Microlunatus sp. Y1700 TaxID=3418487 RepID=UPI003DA74BA2
MTEPNSRLVAVPRRRSGRRVRVGDVILSVVLLVLAALMITPLVWLISQSISEPPNAFQLPPQWIPQPPTLANYGEINSLIPIGRMALNSLTVSVLATVGALLTSTLAAYAFSRISFRGGNSLFSVLLAALMVPVQLTVIPLFILMRTLGLVDNLASVWLPATVNVFGIFFLRQYFLSIPRDLDEAARIDGAGHLRILFGIIVPLATPALSALTIFLFEATWNNYFWPSIFLQSSENMTLPVGLVQLQGNVGGGPAVVVFAAITAVVLPVLVLFLIFQRSFVESIASTGLKS